MSTFVIGDIHNCYLGLKQAIERTNPQKGDTLIFLGDYFDGWSQAKEVLLYLLELKEQYNCIFLKGNHDDWVESWVTGKMDAFALKGFQRYGGAETIKSFESWFKEDQLNKQILIDFLSLLKYHHVDEQNRAFLHAGYTNIAGVEEEDNQVKIWDRQLVQMVLSLDTNPLCLKAHKEVYVGHTPITRYGFEPVPLNMFNLWMMDTAAAFTGKVTVMNINTKEFWQSNPVIELYPNEKGRN
jgi:serine/threonine protein phosphatase 1